MRLTTQYKYKLYKIKDPREYTRNTHTYPSFTHLVLHKACINDQEQVAEALIDIVEDQLKEIYQKEEKVRGMMKFWINAKTDEGFTAMHFSSFKGNTVL